MIATIAIIASIALAGFADNREPVKSLRAADIAAHGMGFDRGHLFAWVRTPRGDDPRHFETWLVYREPYGNGRIVFLTSEVADLSPVWAAIVGEELWLVVQDNMTRSLDVLRERSDADERPGYKRWVRVSSTPRRGFSGVSSARLVVEDERATLICSTDRGEAIASIEMPDQFVGRP